MAVLRLICLSSERLYGVALS